MAVKLVLAVFELVEKNKKLYERLLQAEKRKMHLKK